MSKSSHLRYMGCKERFGGVKYMFGWLKMGFMGLSTKSGRDDLESGRSHDAFFGLWGIFWGSRRGEHCLSLRRACPVLGNRLSVYAWTRRVVLWPRR